MCRECGYTMKCPNCNISLTYHSFQNKLKCHYCGHEEKTVKICPSCGSDMVYDGSFNHRLVPGEGITAHILKINGIKVYTENDLEEIKKIY